MAGWGEYIAAFVTFFTSHRLPLRPGIKGWLSARIGAFGFTLAYSTMSVAVLTWVIIAAGRAPYLGLWEHAVWMNHVTLTLMAVASVIFTLALGRPNPLSFGGWNNDRFDPRNSGLIGWARHPLLVVLGLWSLAHILPNGNLAHVLMFGQFAIFSLIGQRIIDRRKQRLLGDHEWVRLSATTRRLSLSLNGTIRLVVGLALYLTLLYAHAPVIGVDPLGF
ncbi:MAG: NnrU family protein [Rhodobacteraceae bacterium]|nr:NnrU family protein [Paracoccaceae bacterium]